VYISPTLNENLPKEGSPCKVVANTGLQSAELQAQHIPDPQAKFIRVGTEYYQAHPVDV